MDLFTMFGVNPDVKTKDEKEEYVKLKEQINHHMKKYYDDDAPEISDYEYDQLMIRLKEMEKMHPQWVTPDSPTQKVGGTTENDFGADVKHNVPMLSIHDVFSFDEVRDWIAKVHKVHPDATFSVERKIDGLSMTERYLGGKLTLGESRGDGFIGSDVTASALVIPDVKKELPIKGYVELRGEVYMTHADFERHNKTQEEMGAAVAANPRNLAAGTLRLQNSALVKERGLHMFVFNVQDADEMLGELMTEQCAGLDYLESLGVPVVEHTLCRTTEEVIAEIIRLGETRGDLDYDMDGAVVKINEIAYRKDFFEGNKYSAGHIAYKYPPEEKEVVIDDIEVAVGRTGKLTFRARFKEPVRLCGTSVVRATLHNIDFINKMGVVPGCRAICRKQGEIIPAIVRVLDTADEVYEAPQFCPVCGEPLVKDDASCDIYCVNPACAAQLKRSLIYFAGKDAMDIRSLGASSIEQLVDCGFLHDYADFYSLHEKRDRLIDLGIIGRVTNTDKVLDAIENSKKNDATMFLTGLGIRNVGKSTAKQLMARFSGIEELSHASAKELTQVEDIGDVTAAAVVQFFSNPKMQAILDKFRAAGVNMESKRKENVSDKLAGLTIAVTGTLPSLKRSEAVDLIEANGGKASGSVSKKTNYLLAGENAGSKLDKANELNIPVISEKEFLSMIER